MKRIISATLLLSLAACSSRSDQPESLGESNEELNGDLSGQGFLKRKNIAAQDETARRQDTDYYYANVGTSEDGTAPSIRKRFPNLAEFRRFQGFDAEEVVTRYYNRGDLGLGREMHCAQLAAEQQTACYVSNFASGSDGSEFTFGFSRDIAFSNMNDNRVVATVAMVFSKKAAANRVWFVVFDGAGQRVNTAPLDRHGLNFFNGFAANGNVNPDPTIFGTPGVEFNNHIPSNCLNCHGGSYDPSTDTVTGALFLPFDLDQFDYQQVSGQTRGEQEDDFRTMNQMVRAVAASVAGTSSPLVKQIDGWYGNTRHSATLTGDFNSAFVPTKWNTDADRSIYASVLRPSCRGCHLTASLPLEDPAFEDPASFPDGLAAALIATHSMPHALQTQREFWLSGQPALLEQYFRAKASAGDTDALGAANTLAAAGPGNIVTLDPQNIMAAVQ